MFADFKRDGANTTLGSDLAVDGSTTWRPIPAPTSAARATGGYDVRLTGDRSLARRESELRFAVTRDGKPVSVDPFLGARGHLVALREGDLGYLHVHPVESEHNAPEVDPGSHQAPAEAPIAFVTEFPG